MKFPRIKISFVINNIIREKSLHVKGKLSFFEGKVMIFWRKWRSFLQKRIIIRSFRRIRTAIWNLFHRFFRHILFVFSAWTCHPSPLKARKFFFCCIAPLLLTRDTAKLANLNFFLFAAPVSAAATKKHPLCPKAEGMKELNNRSNSF